MRICVGRARPAAALECYRPVRQCHPPESRWQVSRQNKLLFRVCYGIGRVVKPQFHASFLFEIQFPYFFQIMRCISSVAPRITCWHYDAGMLECRNRIVFSQALVRVLG